MTARQFKTALDQLGWSEEEAAAQLGAWAATPHLVSEWRQGKRPVPKRVATHVRAALSLRLWVQSYVRAIPRDCRPDKMRVRDRAGGDGQ